MVTKKEMHINVLLTLRLQLTRQCLRLQVTVLYTYKRCVSWETGMLCIGEINTFLDARPYGFVA